jgi:hypothetical protein
MKQVKVIIQLNDGTFIENFTKLGYVFTKEIKRSGEYCKSIAIKRLEKFQINDATLILVKK